MTCEGLAERNPDKAERNPDKAERNPDESGTQPRCFRALSTLPVVFLWYWPRCGHRR